MELNLSIQLLNIHKHKPSLKKRKERELLLSAEERKELETFAKCVINRSTAYNKPPLPHEMKFSEANPFVW